ncbi:tripartite tricarboxylate transporter permease [Defluviimonas sp. SAOS-178_SWC]|uniref:tripartite tricarboxylate transporter permease n=1 Tax=Defluviimonas sp. SAOS-178_SWC TaxID=3121287 RepID=UPI0032219DAD
MEYFGIAAGMVFTPASLLAILAGTFIGLVVGALPGLGSVVAITLVLPFSFSMETAPAICLILSVYCCSVFGGSYSAILLNTPGTPQSAATVLDGYAMAKRGEADLALGWATGASAIGGIFSTFVLLLFAPQLARVALSFGPIENFALTCFALTCIAGVAGANFILGIISGLIGLFLATVGVDPLSGETRMTFGYFGLSSGIELIPVLIGIFAIAEVFDRATAISKPSDEPGPRIKAGFRLAPLAEWTARWGTLLKSSVIGSFVGVLPGTGASTASFISYAVAKRTGRFRKDVGTGEAEGIVASETANNAVTGGALVPTLALGIPGDPVTAVMMSALVIHGIQPGTRLFVESPELIYASFVALLVINVVMFVAAAPFAHVFSRILHLPDAIIAALVLILSVLGAYGVRGNMFDLYVMLAAGVVGYMMRLAAIPAAPIVIGMVLGPFVEESLRQGLILTDGNIAAFFGRPIAAALMSVTILIVLSTAIMSVVNLASRLRTAGK